MSPPGKVVDFDAVLASRSEDRQPRPLRLHIEIAPFEHSFVTVGLINEFVRHPLENLARGLVAQSVSLGDAQWWSRVPVAVRSA